MIRLSAGDIVRRAAQLADLENSSFITWNENINLLNEAYTTLYQRVINHGDKYYLRKVTLGFTYSNNGRETRFALPDDFYQLMSINVAETNEPILRRSLNDQPRSLRYDIVNGELIVYGDFNRQIAVSYYPVPLTLTYPAPEEPLATTGMDGSTLFDASGKIIVYKSSDTAVTVYDGYTFDDETLDIGATVTSIIAGKNGFMVNGRAYTYALSPKYTGKPLVLDGRKCINVFDGGKVLTLGGRTVLETDLTGIVTGALDGAGGLYWLDGAGKVHYWSAEVTETDLYGAGTDTRYMMYSDGGLYRLTSGGLLDELAEGRAIADDALSLIGVDGSTGYGYAAYERGSYRVRTFVQDTELDYPNNLYVQCMAFALAMAYKAKQNADSTQLAAMYDEALHQYYDSVGRDDYASPRIQNVY